MMACIITAVVGIVVGWFFRGLFQHITRRATQAHEDGE